MVAGGEGKRGATGGGGSGGADGDRALKDGDVERGGGFGEDVERSAGDANGAGGSFDVERTRRIFGDLEKRFARGETHAAFGGPEGDGELGASVELDARAVGEGDGLALRDGGGVGLGCGRPGENDGESNRGDGGERGSRDKFQGPRAARHRRGQRDAAGGDECGKLHFEIGGKLAIQ